MNCELDGRKISGRNSNDTGGGVEEEKTGGEYERELLKCRKISEGKIGRRFRHSLCLFPAVKRYCIVVENARVKHLLRASLS